MEPITTEMSPPEPPEPNELERFAANIAHDFNNLLTGILGNLELMQNYARRNGETRLDGYLEGARNAGGRAAILTQRLLAFSGRGMHDFTPVAVAPLIREAIEPLRGQGSRLSAEFPGDGIKIFCDPAQAELALQELLCNAVIATQEKGEIAVKTTIVGRFVAIAIHDTGAGMTPAILARVTEPFFTTQPSGAGKGLGLSIASRFARQAGGSLEITSEPGQGTTVRLLLPELPS
jgi:signal transduction histidine kinase